MFDNQFGQGYAIKWGLTLIDYLLLFDKTKCIAEAS